MIVLLYTDKDGRYIRRNGARSALFRADVVHDAPRADAYERELTLTIARLQVLADGIKLTKWWRRKKYAIAYFADAEQIAFAKRLYLFAFRAQEDGAYHLEYMRMWRLPDDPDARQKVYKAVHNERRRWLEIARSCVNVEV